MLDNLTSHSIQAKKAAIGSIPAEAIDQSGQWPVATQIPLYCIAFSCRFPCHADDSTEV